jgi:hypothetical protein
LGKQNTFTIHRPQARLHVHYEGSESFSASEGRFTFKGSEQDYPYIDINGGKSEEVFLITVATPLRTEESDPVVELVQSGATWKLRITKQGSEIEMAVHDQGTLPEFEVIQNDFAY